MIIEKNSKWLFYGDSITDAGRARPAGEGHSGALGSGYVNMIGGLIDAVYPDYNIRVVNRGVSGDNTRNLMARWETDVVAAAPDYLSILIGVNDVWRMFDTPHMTENHVPLDEYRKRLEWLVMNASGFAKNVMLMVPFIIEPGRDDPMRSTLDAYGDAVRSLAARHNCILVDLQTEFDKFCAHLHSYAAAGDRVHPNHVGNAVIARAALRSVGFDFLREA